MIIGISKIKELLEILNIDNNEDIKLTIEYKLINRDTEDAHLNTTFTLTDWSKEARSENKGKPKSYVFHRKIELYTWLLDRLNAYDES